MSKQSVLSVCHGYYTLRHGTGYQMGQHCTRQGAIHARSMQWRPMSWTIVWIPTE